MDESVAIVNPVSVKPDIDANVFKVPRDLILDKSESKDCNESEVKCEKQIKNDDTKSDSGFKKTFVNLSPAEKLKHTENVLPYKEPSWGGLPVTKYHLDILKNGKIIGTVDLCTKSYYVCGRLPNCDIVMEHPSLSRYHGVLQYSSDASKRGWYYFDLDSTHGSWINKKQVTSSTYHRFKVGHQLKLGGSSRIHILQGPDEDQDDEKYSSKHDASNVAKQHIADVLKQSEADTLESATQEMQCDWGMADDAVEEVGQTPLSGDALALSTLTDNEELYIDDPKKALKGFFEREGFDLPKYEFSEAGFGKKKCTVELPVDDDNGHAVVAEVTGSGKKKELTAACALEACRILDRYSVLRAATHESHKRKAKKWEDNDFYESDEDTFFDRTGTIESKRAKRMLKEKKQDAPVETYESLLVKHKEVENNIKNLENQLNQSKMEGQKADIDGEDALDAYMKTIKSGMMDTSTKFKIRTQLISLKKDEAKLRKLVNLTKPSSVPELKCQLHDAKSLAMSKESSLYQRTRRLHALKESTRKKLQRLQKSRFHDDNEDDDNDTCDDDDNGNNEEDKLEHVVVNANVQSNSGNDEELSLQNPSQLDSNVVTQSTIATHDDKCENKTTIDEPPINQSEARTNFDANRIDTTEYSCDDLNEQSAESNRIGVTKTTTYQTDIKSPSAVVPPNRKTNVSKSNSCTEQFLKKARKDQQTWKADPDYVDWLPPVDQSGDGRTSLNEKYGY